MAKVRLSTRIISDLVDSSEMAAFNFARSIVGNINVFEASGDGNFWCAKSLVGNSAISERCHDLKGTLSRALVNTIDEKRGIPQIVALRRSNIPIPPCGELWLMSQKGETRFKQSVLQRGDTHVINLVAYGDFPVPPKVVFAIKDDIKEKPIIVKDRNIVLNIIDIENVIGFHQKAQIQIVLNPGDTENIERTKTLFYTCEIVDKQVDEVYTVETGKITIAADVYNYFKNK